MLPNASTGATEVVAPELSGTLRVNSWYEFVPSCMWNFTIWFPVSVEVTERPYTLLA